MRDADYETVNFNNTMYAQLHIPQLSLLKPSVATLKYEALG